MIGKSVLILDFGSQYTQLIARRVRELEVYCEILPYNTEIKDILLRDPGALIFSGGPSSVYEEGAPKSSAKIMDLGIPILGICYGLQLLAYFSGMKVESASEREYGLANLQITGESELLEGVKQGGRVWMSHGDKITQFPEDFSVTARTENSEIAVIESSARKIYGIQFHAEVVHTEDGAGIISNFLFNISGLVKNWSVENFISSSVKKIRDTVGDRKVILGLSGGVDSTVLALLLQKAIGEKLTPVFIDTGLLRKNEFDTLMKRFRDELHLDVTGINAGEIFLKKLKGVTSPEEKRKIIGKTFIDIFSTVEDKIGKVEYFAQGTLYPDVIESISVKGPSATIKSHHNVGGLPEKMNWKLIEPFRELFKDEVRNIGRELGLDEKFIMRHPFPGPGLAIRVIGDISREKIYKLQEADAILKEELDNFDLYNSVWQSFVVLLPVKTVGVMGDVRTYENVAVIRLVESIDGMTADWFPAPSDFLKKVANRIVNEVKGINRVTYDLTSKPPGTIEWE